MMKVHHVGYLVSQIDGGIFAFGQMGFILKSGPVYDAIRDINIAFVVKDGYCIELIEPCTEKSVVYKLHKKIGNSPYHICYSTDNIEEDLSVLKNDMGAVQLDNLTVAKAIDN